VSRSRNWATTLAIAAIVAGAVGAGPGALAQSQPPGATSPELAGCPVLPADDIWNTPIDTLPVDPSSDAYIATIGADIGFHPDFGADDGGPIGIPYVVVTDDQAPVNVTFDYADESDAGPYPIPADAPIEGGPEADGDRHVLVVNSDTCTLYELFYAVPQDDGTWLAGSGAVFDLRSSALRPETWTSADAAGLPILPGLVRYDEVASGEIRHALRFTTSETRRDYAWPARHFASDEESTDYPPMGQRFRLHADYDISGFSPEVQVILQALKTYGMILADNGSPWYISGAPDERWNNEELHDLKDVLGSDLEAVDQSSLMVDPDSGQAAGAGSPRPTAAPEGTTAPEATTTPEATAAPEATEAPAATKAPASTTAPEGSPTALEPNPLEPVEADLYVSNGQASGDEDGSKANPFSTIAAALAAAKDGDTIAVAAGDYPELVLVRDRTLHLFGGHSADFSERDPTTNVTSIIGDGTDSVVSLVEAADSTIDGFRITGGTRSLLPEYGYLGGGVFIQGGAPTIANNLIEGNDTRSLPLGDSDPLGGGIFADGSNVSILDNVIRGNTSGRGAGIAITSGTPIVSGNTVQDNVGVADHGGGVYVAATNAEISGNLIIGNEIGRDLGYGWGGGMIVFDQGTTAALSFNEVTGNYAPSVGSGVFIDDGAVVTMDHEFIHHNDCPDGGTTGGVGIYVDGYDTTIGSTVTIDHTTVAGNDCETQGGNGLYVEAQSRVTVTNSIFWGNGGDDFLVDGTSTIDASYITSEEAIEGDGNLTSDPLFADLADGDVHLQPGSPAIDAGDPKAPFDREPEPNGGRVDQGRYGDTAAATSAGQ